MTAVLSQKKQRDEERLQSLRSSSLLFPSPLSHFPSLDAFRANWNKEQREMKEQEERLQAMATWVSSATVADTFEMSEDLLVLAKNEKQEEEELVISETESIELEDEEAVDEEDADSMDVDPLPPPPPLIFPTRPRGRPPKHRPLSLRRRKIPSAGSALIAQEKQVKKRRVYCPTCQCFVAQSRLHALLCQGSFKLSLNVTPGKRPLRSQLQPTVEVEKPKKQALPLSSSRKRNSHGRFISLQTNKKKKKEEVVSLPVAIPVEEEEEERPIQSILGHRPHPLYQWEFLVEWVRETMGPGYIGEATSWEPLSCFRDWNRAGTKVIFINGPLQDYVKQHAPELQKDLLSMPSVITTTPNSPCAWHNRKVACGARSVYTTHRQGVTYGFCLAHRCQTCPPGRLPNKAQNGSKQCRSCLDHH